MSNVFWEPAEVELLRTLTAQGMSASKIAVELTALGRRSFIKSSVQRKIDKIEDVEGRIRPAAPTIFFKPGQKPKAAPKPRVAKPVAPPQPKKRSMIPANQRYSLMHDAAARRYRPAPVIAGFPTMQVLKGVDGSALLAPVTLRRIDFGGARA